MYDIPVAIVIVDGKNIDVFSLDYSTNNNTRLDAMASALDWMDNV
jgi:hypothetical protein